MKKLLLLLFVSAGLVSCDFSVNKKNKIGDKVSGEKIAGWYYYHVMDGSYDSLPQLMAEDFYSNKTQEGFVQELKERASELGPIQSFTLKEWETLNVKTRKDNDTEFQFVYDIDYEKGKGEETILLERKDHKIKITQIDFVKK